jgi:hypothetical protein
MSHGRMSASSVAHKSTGGTLQSLPEPVDPGGPRYRLLDLQDSRSAPPSSPRFLEISGELLELPVCTAVRRRTLNAIHAPRLAMTWTNLSRVQRIGPASEPRWRNSSPGNSA